ncbi:MAG: LuxR C-terminal-related transcriptional regulator, partial [Anaerolineales bacterium]
HILTVFYRGETMLVHSWLKALPEAVIRQWPLLCAMYANTIAHAGGFQSAALLQTSHWLEVANQALRGQGVERNESGKLHQPADHLTQSFIATTRAYLALWRGDSPQTVIELARQALADLPPTDKEPLDLNFLRLRSGLSNNIGFSYLMLGDEEAAIQAYAEAQRIGKSCGDLLNMYSAIARQVFILRRHGRLPEAATLCQKAMNATETGTKPERSIPYLGVIYLALGQILLEWNDLAAAKNALTKSLELSRLMAETDAQLESSISLTHIKLAEGDVQSALDLLDQIDLVSEKAKILVPAWRARIHIAQSNQHPEALNKALQWAEGKVLRECDPFWPAIEPLTLARVLIAQCRSASHSATAHPPDLNPLLQFLDLQIQTAEKGNWVERMIELRVLQALTWHVQKHLPEALDSLHNALDLAEPGGYMRLFLDEGLPIRRLLSKIKVDNNRINRYIGKLLVAAGETGPVSRLIPDQQPLIEPLSMRELEVLRLLVLGSSNAEIAQELVITLNTTKKHVTHIFEKLGATNRAEAAQRAMDLGLIPPSSHPT